MNSAHPVAVEHGTSPRLAHHFDDLEQQHASAVLGMWTFLATEVMFFGGLFAAYALFRFLFPWEMILGSRHLSVPLGAFNTAVLLISSLTMAMAVHEAQLGHAPRRVVWYLVATMSLGTAFLGIKAIEYHREYVEGLIPALNYSVPEEDREKLDEIAKETGYTPHPERMQMFSLVYFCMTGLHAIHLVIGIVLVGIIAMWVGKDQIPGGGATHVEITGLYWHFIDVVWVFLYPLLYLIDIHK